MEISEYMKQDVISLPDTATVGDAARMVVEHRVGTLPIVDESGQLVGVVSLAQLLKLVMPAFVDMLEDFDFVHDFGAVEDIRPDEAVLSQSITHLMDEPASVEANCGLVRAYTVMRKLRLYDLPVVDENNRLVGLASRVDVARACLAGWETPPMSEAESPT